MKSTRLLRLSAAQIAHTAALLVVVFLGVALRVHKLDAQSLWYDEGNSARIAERSLQLIIEGAGGDIHPPLYYVALHYWRMAFGESEAALRSLSVLAGALLVVFTYLAGRSLFGSQTGLIAAALVAFSPFAVYYSQEARMYILLALAATASTWALFGILDFRLGTLRVDSTPAGNALKSKITNRKSKIRKSKIALYVLATAAGLYTQYAYPFVMIAQGICVLLWLAFARQDRLRALGVYIAMNVVAIALFLPWLPIAIRQVTSWTVTPQHEELGAAVLDAYRWLVTGRTLPLDQALLPMVVVGGLASIGLLSALLSALWQALRQRTAGDQASQRASQHGFAAVALAVLAALPFTLLFVFKLYREAYLKFLLVCAPPLLTLAARGIAGIVDAAFGWRASAGRSRGFFILGKGLAEGALTCLVIISLAPSLDNLYNNPAYARDDYRSIARMVAQNARAGDAVLFNAPNQWEVFTYYHHEGAPAIALPYRPENEAAVATALQPIVEQYTRLFVLYYGERESDPESRFERWLATHAFKADEQWIGNIRLAVYATHAPKQAHDIDAGFGAGDASVAITLRSDAIDLDPRSNGDLIPLQLVWRSNASLAQRYKVFVHLGPADAPPVAQNDAEPVGGFRPTTTWQAGEEIVDQRAIWIKPGTPAGTYGLYIGVYDSATGQRLAITGSTGAGDRLLLGTILIR
ncbi:MAG: glycosyltransferase family 39 protein [Chloroflexi bacterium]|nr:glycosyltransferase family 39 protein [Chloroflexota bacterium]